MKLQSLLTAGMLAGMLFASSTGAEAQVVSRSGREMQQATMKAYDKLIAENPKDFKTLYSRANGYYRQNQLGKALSDVNAAIHAAPATDKGFLFDAYSLRGGIYEQMKKYDEALADYKKALGFSPKDYGTMYQIANLDFEKGDYASAKKDYQGLKKLNPRSQEALFGLARVAIKENDIATAQKLCKEGVELEPSQAVSYMRQASVYRMMGNNADAVDDYAIALQLDRNMMPAALREMAELATTDYAAVMTGLQKAIDKNPRNGVMYYIRAMIAKAHFHYMPAIADFNYIETNNLLNLPSLYTELADCYYNLGKYAEALEKAAYAIGSSSNNRDAYVMKSLIKSAQGAYKSAIENADKAILKDQTYAPAFIAKGIAQQGFKLYPEASSTFGSALQIDGRYPMYYFFRADVLRSYLNMPEQAKPFYEDVLKMEYPEGQVASLKGFADLFLGNTAEGDAWIDALTSGVKDGDGEIAYYAACYWAQRGDKDKAFKYMEDALKAGYASYHNWTKAVDGGINVAPLRGDARFDALLKSYGNLFN